MTFEEGIRAIGRADWLALLVAIAVGLILVVATLFGRQVLLRVISYRALINTLAALGLIAAVGCFVATYSTTSTYLVSRALAQDARLRGRVDAKSLVRPISQGRTERILAGVTPLGCAYPAWTVHIAALLLVPFGVGAFRLASRPTVRS